MAHIMLINFGHCNWKPWYSELADELNFSYWWNGISHKLLPIKITFLLIKGVYRCWWTYWGTTQRREGKSSDKQHGAQTKYKWIWKQQKVIPSMQC